MRNFDIFRLTFLVVLYESFLQKGCAAFHLAFVGKEFGDIFRGENYLRPRKI